MVFFEGSPQQQMADVVALMRDMSTLTDPQEVVQRYRERVGKLLRNDAALSLSRRGLENPWFRITRSSRWKEDINPWAEPHKLPLLKGGLLAELLYADQPTIIQDLPARLSPDDPAYEHLRIFGSAYAMPLYENGEAINMNVSLMREKNAIDESRAPMILWLGNLFGRATRNLVLAGELRRANEALDRELRTVSEIQRSLLPPTLPDVQHLRLAAHYETSARAGGDYYDLFPLSHGRLGMLIADVSGHGTPAAVMMAITHTLAHSPPRSQHESVNEPAAMLAHLNERLSDAYTRGNSGFVTAFYGVFDPTTRVLRYSSAGHNPPRLRRAGSQIEPLEGGRDVPLGVLDDTRYHEDSTMLHAGDALLLYTDGITEARNAGNEEFGTRRLDEQLSAAANTDPGWMIASVLEGVAAFTRGKPAEDDRTLVAAEVH